MKALLTIMMKKAMIILSAALLAMSVALFMVCAYTAGSISYGKYPMQIRNSLLLTAGDEVCLFDSGALRTVFKSKIPGQKLVGATLVTDCNKKHRIAPLYYVSGIELSHGFWVRRFVFNRVAFHAQASEPQKLSVGIIGMNIIRKANWHFSIRDSFFETLPLDRSMSIPSDAVVLSYDNNKRPLTTLVIEHRKYEDVLIDMGCDKDFGFSSLIMHSITNKVEPQYISQRSQSGVFSSNKKMSYLFDSVYVLGKIYPNISMCESKYNLVGMKFLSRFDHLFWDSRHKKVYLWNDEEK